MNTEAALTFLVYSVVSVGQKRIAVVRGLGYAAILKNNQLSPSRAVENLGKVFWVPGFEIASCVICRFPLVPESPDHAIDYDVEAFVVRQWSSQSE